MKTRIRAAGQTVRVGVRALRHRDAALQRERQVPEAAHAVLTHDAEQVRWVQVDLPADVLSATFLCLVIILRKLI
jgi:hypothetical protein